MKTVREILEDAKSRIEPEGAWTRNHMAVGSSGTSVSPRARYAVAWCAMGTLEASIDLHDREKLLPPAIVSIARVINPDVEWMVDDVEVDDDYGAGIAGIYECVTAFNDQADRTQQEVVDVFARAIAGLDE